MDWHGDTEGEIVVLVNVRGETKDALVGELSLSVLQVHGVIDHEEGVVSVDLSDTVSHAQSVINVVSCERVLIGNLKFPLIRI